MSRYELVCVIDAGIWASGVKTLKEKIEQMVKVVETDDMGLLPTVYPIAGQAQAYYVSYLVEVDPIDLPAIKMKMKLEPGLDRYVFYAIKGDQKFLKYADLQKAYADILDAQEAAREEGKSSVEAEEPVEETA